MGTDRATSLLAAILATQDDEIDCGQFLEVVAQYVDIEVSGGMALQIEPRLNGHLRLCPDCQELYDTLRLIASLEEQGELPEAPALWAALAGATGQTAAKAQPRYDISPGHDSHSTAAAADPTSDRATRPQRSSFWSWLQPQPRLTAASLACAALFGVGWLRAEQHLDDAQRAVYWAGHAREIRSARAPDGAWVRVLYDPAADTMFVVAGDFPPADESVECWLTGVDGKDMPIGEFAMGETSKHSWWVVDAPGPMEGFTSLSLKGSGEPLQVSLER